MKGSDHLNSSDHVYLSVREQIFDGRIPPNSFINIQSLAALHKVSTLPVREALIRLTAEDLVDHNRSRGFMAYMIKLNTLIDSYHIMYNLFQLNLRLSMAVRPKEFPVNDDLVHIIPAGKDLTASGVDEAIEFFASRLMREQFYLCFLRELRRTRPFRYQTFQMRGDTHKILEYISNMKELAVSRNYSDIYRLNRDFYRHNARILNDIYQYFVEYNRKY